MDRPDGTLTDFIERFLPLSDLSLWGVPPENYRTYRHVGGSDRPAVGIGLPRMNFPPRWKVRLNSLYWPSGATRWAQFVGIVDSTTLKTILQTVEGDGGQQNNPQQLVLCDSQFPQSQIQPDSFQIDSKNRVALSVEMYLLRPRMLQTASGNVPGLWLLPLVDERYWWQYRTASPTVLNAQQTPTPNSLWGDLIDEIGVTDIGGVNRSQYDSNFPGPDAFHWSRKWALGPYLEAVACNLGMRVVRSIDRTVSLDIYSDSAQTLTQNISGAAPFTPFQQIAGGDFSSTHRQGAQAATVETVFSQHPEDFCNTTVIGGKVFNPVGGGPPFTVKGPPIMETDVQSTDVNEQSGGVGTPATKRYFTTAHTTDQTQATNLAQAIAKAYFGWQQSAFDYVFLGIKAWQQTGFDDATEWRLDWDPKAYDRITKTRGNYAFFTRVQSLPPNCGFSDLPHTLDWEPTTDIEVLLLTDLASGSDALGQIVGPSVSDNGTDGENQGTSRMVPVWDGMGLCDPIPAGTTVKCGAVPRVVPDSYYRDFAYIAYAAECACSS
jgi:hypothetical protein